MATSVLGRSGTWSTEWTAARTQATVRQDHPSQSKVSTNESFHTPMGQSCTVHSICRVFTFPASKIRDAGNIGSLHFKFNYLHQHFSHSKNRIGGGACAQWVKLSLRTPKAPYTRALVQVPVGISGALLSFFVCLFYILLLLSSFYHTVP